MTKRESHKHLINQFLGFLTPKCIQAAVQIGLADALINGPLHVGKIAERTGTLPEPLYRLLRFLSSNGIFHEESGQVFALNGPAELLRSDVVETFGPYARFLGEYVWDTANHFVSALREGKVPWEEHYGKPSYETISEDPDLIELFNGAMIAESWPFTDAVLDSYDLQGITTFADIGGGHGEVAINVLRRYPQVKAFLFDLPPVAEKAVAAMENAGLSERCSVVGGDFFDSVPIEADIYFVRGVMGDWSDNQCVRLLSNIAAAARPGARVLLSERLIHAPNEAEHAKQMDILMMFVLPGRFRTADECNALLAASGFRPSGVTETDSFMSVVEGTKKK